jgi:hypothetical protein
MEEKMQAAARWARFGLAAGLAVVLGGCQAGLQEAYKFPVTWPGSRPLGEEAPTVSVLPLKLNVDQAQVAPQGEEGLPTAAVLSVLLIKHLHVNGINAILEREESSTAQYTLDCSVPNLGYGVQGKFPQERYYKAELKCVLKDEQNGEVIWERNLAQGYEEMVLLNMLTHVPAEPHKDDRVLFRECIIPLWDAMAASIGAVVTTRERLLQQQSRVN